MQRPLLFTTAAYAYLAQDLLTGNEFEAGAQERKHFPDGERYQRVGAPVYGRNVILLAGTHDDTNTLELFDLAYGLVTQGAGRLTLVIPYYAFSTMERAVKDGEVVTAKSRAHLLSYLPKAPGGNSVILLDPHAETLPSFFESGTNASFASGTEFVYEAARELAGGRPFVMASTDAGRLKAVQRLAAGLGVDAAVALKHRDETTGETHFVAADTSKVKGKVVIMYDDMIRTGGSLITAARAYHKAEAVEVHAIATHGVLPGNALDRLTGSGMFGKIVVSNSHPRTQELSHPQFVAKSVGRILAAKLRQVLHLGHGPIMTVHE